MCELICGDNSSSPWNETGQQMSRGECPILTVILSTFVLDSDVLWNAHMAVTACSIVVKNIFSWKFYCINLLTCVAKNYYKNKNSLKKNPGVVCVSAFLILPVETQYLFFWVTDTIEWICNNSMRVGIAWRFFHIMDFFFFFNLRLWGGNRDINLILIWDTVGACSEILGNSAVLHAIFFFQTSSCILILFQSYFLLLPPGSFIKPSSVEASLLAGSSTADEVVCSLVWGRWDK